MPMPKDKVRLVTTVGKDLAAAIRAAAEESGISEAMVIRLALSEYLEVPMTDADQRAITPHRRPRLIDKNAIEAAATNGTTRRDSEVNSILARLRREKGIVA